MVRTLVIPDKDSIKLSIPKEYIGVEVEVIAFAKEEGVRPAPVQKKIAFGSLSIDTRGYKFNRDEANER